LKVKLFITETTYIDEQQGKNMMQKARDRGHIHLQELAYYAYLFENVENILLIHFSDKYSPSYIQYTVRQKMTDSLVDKVHVATVAKEKYE
jgi:ribonuclease Z